MLIDQMFTSRSRVMLFAAHPDDESLACSVVLQRAARVGAEVCVIYVSDGENNPWPQRALERRWRLAESDRKRWGNLRRGEAIAALKVLGVDKRNAFFLGLPDQRLTELLVSNAEPVIEKINKIIEAWSPTDVFGPSMLDIHPDHSALGVLLRVASNYCLSIETGISFWGYLVHGNSPTFLRRARAIGQTETETETKLRAIGCHQTQVKLFGQRFWKHALQAERFVKIDERENLRSGGVLVSASRNSKVLSLKLERPLRLLPSTRVTVFVVGHDNGSNLRCIRAKLPMRTSAVPISDIGRGRNLAPASYRGGAFSGALEIPMSIFSSQYPLFIKIERRGWFFDEAGWLELSAYVRMRAASRSKDPQRALPLEIGRVAA